MEISISFTPPPFWLELPTALIENILERLPLSAYIRFGAVCRQWRSIQSDHLRLHAPLPPPMLSLPWLFPSQPEGLATAICFSPFEAEVAAPAMSLLRLDWPDQHVFSSVPHGWLLLYEYYAHFPHVRSYYFSLFNPISAVQIHLEPSHLPTHTSLAIVVSTPPTYVVAAATCDNRLHLFRHADPEWITLLVPEEPRYAVSCGGKLYCLAPVWIFFVVDPFPTPALRLLGMDQSQLPQWNLGRREFSLVDSEGEVLLVVHNFGDEYGVVTGFHVFKADLSRRMWVRVHSLGDRALFLHGESSVSLSAAAVGVRGNCIYFSQQYPVFGEGSQTQRRVFNLDRGRMTVLENPWEDRRHHIMFVPSIC